MGHFYRDLRRETCRGDDPDRPQPGMSGGSGAPSGLSSLRFRHQRPLGSSSCHVGSSVLNDSRQEADIVAIGEKIFALITGTVEFAYFRDFITGVNPGWHCVHISACSQLEALVGHADQLRILSFLSDVIVPGNLLRAVDFPAYNIHPGPPEYPGSHPESFALWNGETDFGVTVHEMTERVDEGVIVMVDRFPIPPGSDRIALADLTYAHAVKAFAGLASHCAGSDTSMLPIPVSWSATKGTKRQFKALCAMRDRLHGNDLARLSRACLAQPIP